MKLIQAILFRVCLSLAGFIFGCGGGITDSGELGSLEQAITSKTGPNHVIGVTTSASHNFCTKTAAGQICLVPGNNTLGYCIETATLTATQANTVRSQLAAVHTATNNKFSFVESAFANGAGLCTGAGGVDWDSVVNNTGSGVCGGNGGDSIGNYSCVNFPPAGGGGSTPMIESFGGAFYNWTSTVGGLGTGAVVHVDLTEVVNRGANATEDNLIFKHALMHGFMALIGVGNQNVTTSQWSSQSILPINQTRTMGALGEACRAGSWSSSPDQTHLNIGTPQCSTDI